MFASVDALTARSATETPAAGLTGSEVWMLKLQPPMLPAAFTSVTPLIVCATVCPLATSRRSTV